MCQIGGAKVPDSSSLFVYCLVIDHTGWLNDLYFLQLTSRIGTVYDRHRPSRRKLVDYRKAVTDGECVGVCRVIRRVEADIPPVRRALVPRLVARHVLRAAAILSVFGLTAWTAALTKRATGTPAALANIRVISRPGVEAEGGGEAGFETIQVKAPIGASESPATPMPRETLKPRSEVAPTIVADRSIRWFNGRPIRPVRTMMMTVTAYSPDARSCGESADGITATLHSVTTNGHRLVAADPKVLAYGSMISIPGYDQGRIVPVLDCGAKIKGRRLDVLYATHEEALKWGNRNIKVTIWGYADGLPADNPRTLR